MKKHNYNFWLAITYEVAYDFAQHFKILRKNKIIRLILNYCKEDWILWRIETALDSVDKQIEKIKKQWESQQKTKHTSIEHEPDGSNAQLLLGGTMEIKSNFLRE
jgi:hypothetical protein